jgi:hypothetical protein
MKKPSRIKWDLADIDRYIDLVRQVGVTKAQEIIKQTKAFRKKILKVAT